jgi:hypothetical protein
VPPSLRLEYRSASDLAAHLEELRQQGALLVRLPEGAGLQQYQAVTLAVCLAGAQAELEAEVLQVIPGLGVALSLGQPGAAFALCGDTAPASPAAPPQVTLTTEVQARGQATGREGGGPRASGPQTWSIEKLQAEWPNLSVPDRIRVAKYGKRPARGLVLRQQDPQLHHFLLSNPHITPEEVAVLAGLGNLDPVLLHRLATSQEWTRHMAVVRNLVCHPKATLQQVTKLVEKLPADELRRLTRTGKVRASVKRVIIKSLERREGRRR